MHLLEVVRKEHLIHKKPKTESSKEYPYSASAKIFHTKQLFLYSEKVEPGRKSSAPHFHKAIDEIAIVTKGELYAYEDDKEVLLKTGDSICFFANSKKKHYLYNKSELDAEFLLFRKNITQEDVVY